MDRRALNRLDDTVADLRQMESRMFAMTEELRLLRLEVRELRHGMDELLSERDWRGD